MKYISSLAICLLFIVGCTTTPDSIQSLSTFNIQMVEAQKTDMEDVINTYDSELNHWIDLTFQQVVEDAEGQLVDSEGKVNLAEYKSVMGDIHGQLANVKGEYEQNKADLIEAVSDKYDKQLLIVSLMDQYEKSVGTSPQTTYDLVQAVGETYHGYQQITMQKKAEKEANKTLSLKDKLGLFINDIGDQVLLEARDKFEGEKPLLPTDDENDQTKEVLKKLLQAKDLDEVKQIIVEALGSLE